MNPLKVLIVHVAYRVNYGDTRAILGVAIGCYTGTVLGALARVLL